MMCPARPEPVHSAPFGLDWRVIAIGMVALGGAAAFVVLPLPLVVLGLIGLATGACAIWAPEWAVAAIVASVPVQRALEGPAGLTATKVVVMAGLAGWLLRCAVQRSPIVVDGIGAAWLVYVVVLVASGAVARDLGAWAGEVYRWGVALAVYVMARQVIASGRDRLPIVGAMMAATAAMALLAFWQVATRAGPPSFSAGGITRAFGTFGEPNPFAGYLEMTVPLFIALVVADRAGASILRAGRWTMAGWAAVLMGTAALALTQSRGGILGFAAGIAAVVWLSGGRVRRIGLVAAPVAVVVVLLTPLGTRIVQRIGPEAIASGGEQQVTVANFASHERAAHGRAAIEMARRQPILGVGAGNFNERFREMTQVWRFRIPRGHAHNAYLQALAQAGVTGLVAYLALIGVVARTLWRRLREAGDGASRALVVGAIGVTTAVAAHNLVEYLHVLSLGLQLAVVWALTTGQSRAPTHFAAELPVARVAAG